MSGGMPSRATRTAFSDPPAAPTATAHSRGREWMQPPVAGCRSKDDCGQPHHRADRQVDAASDDDRRQRNGEEAELDAETRDLEEVAGRREVRRDASEERHLGGNDDEKDDVAGAKTVSRRRHDAVETPAATV